MKKLMIGLVGALAMVACAEVESGIVGYTTRPVENFKFVGPAFMKCASANGDFKISDLMTNCALTEDDAGTGWIELADSVVMLDSNGSFVRRLVFMPQYLGTLFAEELGGTIEQGWYDELDANEFDFSQKWDDTEIPFGYGIQVSTDPTADAKVSFGGALKTTPTVIDVEGFMIVANCAPKTLKLGDLVTNCALTEDDAGTGWIELADSVVMLDSNGSFVRRLVFMPQYLGTLFAEELGGTIEQGWYDELAANEFDFSDKWDNKVEWQPGEAFQVSAEAGAAIIINPAQ